MKRLTIILSALLTAVACSPKQQDGTPYVSTVGHPQWVKDAVMCDSSIDADLDRLSAMGIDILLLGVPSQDELGAFNAFVEKAHSLGMKCLLRYEGDPEMVADSMEGWITDADVDGFRCAGAGRYSREAWDECAARLREAKEDIFLLSDTEVPVLQENAFDAYSSNLLMDRFFSLASRQTQAEDLVYFFIDYPTAQGMPLNTIPLNYIKLPDSGEISDEMLDAFGGESAVKLYAAFTFAVPGIPVAGTGRDNAPLLGDRYGLEEFYTGLIAMRDAHPSLWAQPWGGEIFIIENDSIHRIVAFEREVEGDICLAMFNFSDTETTFTLRQHTATADTQFTLPPYGYRFIFNYGPVEL